MSEPRENKIEQANFFEKGLSPSSTLQSDVLSLEQAHPANPVRRRCQLTSTGSTGRSSVLGLGGLE